MRWQLWLHSTSVRQTNILTRLHYDINHQRRWVACHLSSWLTYEHLFTAPSRTAPRIYSTAAYIHRIVVVPSWDSHATSTYLAVSRFALPWRSWEPFNFFVPSTMSESLFFHQLFFCDAAASSHLVGMFLDENHMARHTSLELDLDQQCTPTILMTMLFFFCRLLVINIGSNQC